MHIIEEKKLINKALSPFIEKVISFLSVVFPGGYRFICVMLITSIYPSEQADLFSKGFFWVVLISTFSGIPISAIMSNRQYYLSKLQKNIAVLFSTFLLSTAFYLAVFFEQDIKYFFVVIIASLSLSFYEVSKKVFFNENRYYEVFISAIISLIGLSLILVFKIEHVLAVAFFIMALPILIFEFGVNAPQNGSNISNWKLISMYRDFSLSNAFSTSLNTAIPLFLIYQLGDEISSQMAQVFSLSSLLILVPRVMSTRNIPKLRKNGPDIKIVLSFYSIMKKYLFVIFTFSSISFFFIYEDEWLVLWLLFFGIQLSQINLPFSNLLSVEGESKKQLGINLKGTAFFILLSLVLFFLVEYNFEIYLLVVFCIHQIFKNYLTKKVCTAFYKA